MPETEITKYEKLKYPILVTDNTLRRLEERANHDGWKLSSIKLEMTNGVEKEFNSREELNSVGAEEWHSFESLSVGFDLPLGQTSASWQRSGHASLTIKAATRLWIDGRIDYYINSQNVGAALALERTINEVFKAAALWYGPLSRSFFWNTIVYVCAGLVIVSGGLKHFFNAVSGIRVLDPAVSIVASCVQLICLVMIFGGARRLFPIITLAIGENASNHLKAERQRQKLASAGWDILKILVGAVIGAYVARHWK